MTFEIMEFFRNTVFPGGHNIDHLWVLVYSDDENKHHFAKIIQKNWLNPLVKFEHGSI